MSTEIIKQIISRAVNEPEFREMLFHNLKKALEGYDLNAEEQALFTGLAQENFDALVSALENRISRAGIELPGVDGDHPDAEAARRFDPYKNFNFK